MRCNTPRTKPLHWDPPTHLHRATKHRSRQRLQRVDAASGNAPMAFTSFLLFEQLLWQPSLCFGRNPLHSGSTGITYGGLVTLNKSHHFFRQIFRRLPRHFTGYRGFNCPFAGLIIDRLRGVTLTEFAVERHIGFEVTRFQQYGIYAKGPDLMAQALREPLQGKL